MPEHLPEQDWKRWQHLAPTLLNRFCDAVVAKAAGFSAGESSGHEKYLALYKHIGESDRDIAIVFNNRRRSNAILQIAAAVARGMMSESELSSFSEETQERVRMIAGIGD
ncbi:MAG TPA: hypothetical protein VN380_19625 [Thermoanaerobaculia bacterium]|jgi:hypothetical protein|nr:hypothetical protein [Thermoanaerobaculia bacterium]